MLNTPTRASVTADELRVNDEIRRDGLRYRVTQPPTVEEAYANGDPACYRVPVEGVRSRAKDNLLYEAGAFVQILRRGV